MVSLYEGPELGPISVNRSILNGISAVADDHLGAPVAFSSSELGAISVEDDHPVLAS